MNKAAFRRIIVGNLRDDITVSASRVQAACVYATVTMWADDLSVIRIDLPEHLEGVSPQSVIGTYGFGGSLIDIEDDLRNERCERAKSWMAE